MILTVMIGALSGWGARQVEPSVTDQLYRWLGERMIADQDRGVAALLACLMGGAAVLSLLGEGDRAFVFVALAAVGYFFDDLRASRKPSGK